MAAVPTLIYMDSPGRADAIRQMFEIAGMEFNDVRLSKAQMAEKKAAGEFPYGMVPVMIVGDKTLPESVAIGRYVARLAGMMPEDPLEAAVVDQFVMHTEDMANAILLTFACSDINVESFCVKLGAEILPKMIGDVERQLEQHSNPFLTGPDITFADLWFVSILEWIGTGTIQGVAADLVDRYPRVLQVRDSVRNQPAVKAYNEKQMAAMAGTECN